MICHYKLASRCEKDETLDKLLDVLAECYRFRTGGFTRIVRTRRRYRDDAPMAFIEFIDRDGEIRPCSDASFERMQHHPPFAEGIRKWEQKQALLAESESNDDEDYSDWY